MKNVLALILNTNAEQNARLVSLQAEFAAACNLVAPVACAQRCWNRVALHHLAYRDVRQAFPQLGSQMACNAIYSVARTYRMLLAHPQSPWSLERRPLQALPSLNFLADAPVYFDRHTLSVRGKMLSLFSLDGRLHFELNVSVEDARRFAEDKLREIVLHRKADKFMLQFQFAGATENRAALMDADLPEYVVITAPPQAAAGSAMTATAELA